MDAVDSGLLIQLDAIAADMLAPGPLEAKLASIGRRLDRGQYGAAALEAAELRGMGWRILRVGDPVPGGIGRESAVKIEHQKNEGPPAWNPGTPR